MWVSSEKTDSDSKTESVFKVKEWMKLLWVWMQDLQFVEENYLFVMSLKPTDFFPTTEKTFIFIFLTGSNKKKIQEKKIYFHQMWNWVRKKKKSVFKGNKKHFFSEKKKSWENVFCVKMKKIRRKKISHERSSKTFFFTRKNFERNKV